MLDPKDLIKEKLDIVEVIRESLALKPAGSVWKALCPFHKEKTPSFIVSPDRQTWHCFGCNKGGDVFSFVMEKEHMEFPEVLRMFAERTGIQLKHGDVKLHNQKTKLYDIMDAAVEWWHARLASDEGKAAREYLAKRGLSNEIIMSWQMGFSPESWDRLSQHLVNKGFTLADIIASGVVIEKPRTSGDTRLPFYDRFRSRVIFPIRDANGTVVGATARVLPGAKEDTAKYMNTPETLIYNKSRLLFALDRAKQAIKEENFGVMVEGNMDAIASHAAGVANVVAVSGTALTPEHAKLLHRYTDSVTLCFDEDIAGQTASRRGVDLLLKEGFEVSVITLPNGVKDPDECIQKSAELWRRAVDERRPMFAALFAKAKERDVTNVREKKAIAKDLLPLIAKVSDVVERSHYVRELSTLLQVPENFLYDALPKSDGGKHSAPPAPTSNAQPTTDRHVLLSERLLAIAVQSHDHLPQMFRDVTPAMIAPGPLRDLYTDMVSLYNQHQSFDVFPALFQQRKEVMDRLVLAGEHFFHSLDRVAMAKEVQTNMTELRRHAIREELTRIGQKIQQADDASAIALLRRADELNRMLSLLA
ncbi:DNA primase [Candidatus Uhrbacteria bacterium]|nr:DNA primase [Candidatus Uhrbacteria bacterium]